jgi:hypothetical protein
MRSISRFVFRYELHCPQQWGNGRRSDWRNAMLDRLLNSFKARSAVFNTAWNPFSTQRGKLANRNAQRQLHFELKQRIDKGNTLASENKTRL